MQTGSCGALSWEVTLDALRVINMMFAFKWIASLRLLYNCQLLCSETRLQFIFLCKAVAWIQERASLVFVIVKSWRRKMAKGGRLIIWRLARGTLSNSKGISKNQTIHFFLFSLLFFLFFRCLFFSFLSFRTVAGRLNRPMGLQVRDIGM